MYYGRGAGKLPTASAVVSDVVDCARHTGKTIMCFWDEQTIKLSPVAQAKHQFFVRVPAGEAAKAQELFGKVTEVKAGIDAEYAFTTEVMEEQEFADKAAQLQVINRIRMEA